MKFTNRRKQKQVYDAAIKISLKYKQRLNIHYGASVVNSPDSFTCRTRYFKMNYFDYVENALRELLIKPVIKVNESCSDSNSSFGSIVKRKAAFAPLVTRLLYGKKKHLSLNNTHLRHFFIHYVTVFTVVFISTILAILEIDVSTNLLDKIQQNNDTVQVNI